MSEMNDNQTQCRYSLPIIMSEVLFTKQNHGFGFGIFQAVFGPFWQKI